MGLAEAFDRSQNLVCGHGLASVSSRPPYFTFHLLNVALLIPCLRQTSAAFAPTSCPRNPDDLVFRAYEISRIIELGYLKLPKMDTTWLSSVWERC